MLERSLSAASPRRVPPAGATTERKAATMRFTLRTASMILGLFGAGVGFVVSLLYSLLHVFGRIAGITADSSHFFIGLGLTIVAVIGALATPVSGVIGALLMLAALIGFAFIVGWWAILPAIFLVPAIVLAFSNRAFQGQTPQSRQPATH